MINPELAQDMDVLCDVIVYMEYLASFDAEDR